MMVRPKFKDLPALPIVRWAATAQPLASVREAPSEPIVQRPLHLGESIAFGRHGNADRYLFADDCHVAEAGFRWAKRTVCRVAFNALFPGPVTLVVRLQIMVERPWSDLQLAVTLNGERLAIRHRIGQPEVMEMIVQNLLTPPARTNILIFYSRLAIVGEITNRPDMRSIGLGLKEMQFLCDD